MLKFAILLIILGISYLIFKFKRRFELGLKIPGPAFIPFIGNFQFATLKPENVFLLVNKLRRTYNRCFRLWLGPNLWVFLHSPEQTREALNNSNLKRAEDFQLLHPLIGDGLLISEGKKWSSRRKALNPAFASSLLEDFLESFSRQADILVKMLKIYEKVEITDRLFLCILDIICETCMGAEVNSQTDPLGIYAAAFHDASHLLFQRMVNPLYAYDFIYKRTKGYERLNSAIKIIHDLTDKVIKEKRENLEKKNMSESLNLIDDDNFGRKKKTPLLDTLLRITIDEKFLSDEDIKEEVNTFLFAGVDTTKSAMSFTFYNLAKHKSIQDRLYEEILSIMGDDALTAIDDNNSENPISVTISHLNQMHFLDLCVKESLRLHTTVPLTGRQTVQETKIYDICVPENSTVWINIYGLAHDSNLFPNPYEFCPERFDRTITITTGKNESDQNSSQNNEKQQQQIPPYSYLPYSGGLHTCIGKRYSILIIKVVIVKVLLSYELSLVNPEEELQLIAEMVLKSKTGINLILKKRGKE